MIFSNQETKKVKAKDDLNSIQQTKKIKLNSVVVSAKNEDKNKENIFSHIHHNELEKLKAEKTALEAKLKHVEELVMNSCDKDDIFIVKNIRDYLGIIFQPTAFENSLDQENINHDESLIDGDFITRPPRGDESIIFVEGESI